MLELKVFTLNCWGIPLVSSNRLQRMKAIAEVLSTENYDVICLQEVWNLNDYNLIFNHVKRILPYGHYFRSGVLGSGVCVLSKYQIIDTFFHQWSLNGYIHKFQHADWYGGKGIGLCRLRVDECVVNIYATHLHAEYNRIADEYRAHRVLQAFDMAQFVRLTAGDANAIILAGDLNIEPDSLEYRLLLQITQLKDSFFASANTNCNDFGTNECAKNSYTPKKMARENPNGKRIDYILYKNGVFTECEVTNYCLPLPYCVPDQSFSYSDHEAVSASLMLFKLSEDKVSSDNGCNSLESTLKEAIEICRQSLSSLRCRKIIYFVCGAICVSMLIVLTAINLNIVYKELVLLLKVVFSFFLFFSLLMATLWDMQERNATLSGIETMEMYVKPVENVVKGKYSEISKKSD